MWLDVLIVIVMPPKLKITPKTWVKRHFKDTNLDVVKSLNLNFYAMCQSRCAFIER